MSSSKRSALVWGAVVAVLLLAAGILVVREGSRTRLRWQAGFLPGDPERGGQLFHDRGCSGCHSVMGLGADRAPDLARASRSPTDLTELAAVMWNHAPAMWEMMGEGPTPELRPGDAADLMAFLFSAGYLEEEGNPRAGVEVLVENGCTKCHTTGMRETRIGPDLAELSTSANPIVWATALWNHAPAMERAMTEEGLAWPELEPREVVDLLAYLRRVSSAPRESPPLPGDPSDGRELFDEHCRQCHEAEGEGGDVGPNLGVSAESRTLTGLSAALWNHSPAMIESMRELGVERPSFTEEEMADLVTYLFAIRYFDPPGNSMLGEAVYERNCETCHGESAQGTSSGPALAALGSELSAPYMIATLWNHGPRMFGEMQARDLDWPVLEATEMRDLIEYLRSLGSEAPQKSVS